jgi:hypothetical protein
MNKLAFDNCTMTPNIRPTQISEIIGGEKGMPSVGPFELTEAEFVGLEFMRQEDERQLRKTTLRATWTGRELSVKAGQQARSLLGCDDNIASRILQY